MPSFSSNLTVPSGDTSNGPSISSSVYVKRVISLVFWKSSGEFLVMPSDFTVNEVGSRQNFFALYFPDLKENESDPPSIVGHWLAVPVPFTSKYVLLWISSKVSRFGAPSALAP
ncbi:hypothetical protein MtrunA17_Chr5g0403131 [Medicago truncatula]|uniref:Uncharacterized protein n=1 Tax=Medicago truncatula TaxID=3880 RepID=A0A396HL90_MEDTR|nr:hypothetical protein MtrunA17_Chr5g0403131 [Medicago truncatula]